MNILLKALSSILLASLIAAAGFSQPKISRGTTGLSDVEMIAAGGFHNLARRFDGTVVAWGNNYYGQSNVPADLSDVEEVAAGRYHSLALKDDGTVVAWGDNSNGQCNVPAGLSNVQHIAAGWYHSIAIVSGGTVVAWGRNADGQCNVPGGLLEVIQISGGENHTLAVRPDQYPRNANGRLLLRGPRFIPGTRAWGSNALNACSVPTGLAGVIQIAAGSGYSLALKSDGTVVGWGGHMSGPSARRIFTDTMREGSTQPDTPPTGLFGVKQIAAGTNQALALKSDGTVVSWGIWGNVVPEGLSDVERVEAGKSSTELDHFLALKSDGTVVAWGSNDFGQCDVPQGVSSLAARPAGLR